MLVDAQLTKTSAEKVLQEIRETKKPLSIIYITREHADHFLGLEVFREAYPSVRIIANAAVVDRPGNPARRHFVRFRRRPTRKQGIRPRLLGPVIARWLESKAECAEY